MSFQRYESLSKLICIQKVLTCIIIIIISLFTFMHWRRKWQPTPVFLPGESQGRRSLVGCRLWGHTESDTTEATQQQQQQQQGYFSSVQFSRSVVSDSLRPHLGPEYSRTRFEDPWKCMCVCAESLQPCLTLCDPMDCPLSIEFPRQEYWSG